MVQHDPQNSSITPSINRRRNWSLARANSSSNQPAQFSEAGPAQPSLTAHRSGTEAIIWAIYHLVSANTATTTRLTASTTCSRHFVNTRSLSRANINQGGMRCGEVSSKHTLNIEPDILRYAWNNVSNRVDVEWVSVEGRYDNRRVLMLQFQQHSYYANMPRMRECLMTLSCLTLTFKAFRWGKGWAIE